MNTSDFDKHLYALGLEKVVERYLDHFFDLHGEVLPADGVYHWVMGEIEKPLLEVILRRLKGNQVRAAKLLGINRNTLRRKVNEHQIEIRE